MITAAKVKFKKPLGKKESKGIVGANQIVEREEEIELFLTKDSSNTENKNECEAKVHLTIILFLSRNILNFRFKKASHLRRKKMKNLWENSSSP